VWRDAKGAPYVPSFMVAGEFLFSLSNAGDLVCYEAATGKVFWQEKLGRHHASPVLVGGLVFFISDKGEINVIRPARAFERVAKYELGEMCFASPAISRGQVFLRGFKNLYCIGKPAP
jgi:outer membrane protein assembly factor BamB